MHVCHPELKIGARKTMQTFLHKVFQQPFGSWTSAPKIVDVHTKKCVFLRPGGGEKLFDPGHSGVRVRNVRGKSGPKSFMFMLSFLAHQNRTIAIASDLRVDGAKSPEIPLKEGVLGSEIAARNRRSLATFHRTLKSHCIIAVSCLGNRAISGVCDGHRNRKSQKSLRFRCQNYY